MGMNASTDRVSWAMPRFTAQFDIGRAAWTSFSSPDDATAAEFLLTPGSFPQFDRSDARWFGAVEISLSIPGEAQHSTFVTSSLVDHRSITTADDQILVDYSASPRTRGLAIRQDYQRHESGLRWETHIVNTTDAPITLESVGVPLFMNQYFRGDDRFKYEQCVLRHACICGLNSWFYWTKPSGQMPVLLVKAMGGTSVESFGLADSDDTWGPVNSASEAFEGLYTAYVVSKRSDAFPDVSGARELAPKESLTYSFLIAVQPDHEAAADWLAENGGFHLETTPGMALTRGTPATLTIKSKTMPEVFSDDGTCVVQNLVAIEEGTWSAELALGGYGRCQLSIEIEGLRSTLVYWGIEPPETIFASQASFIATKQWETDARDPAFHGLLMWDMYGKQRVNSSSSTDAPRWMAGGSDEIGLVSGLFLSEWNVYRPDEDQIRVLDGYCRDFIEGRLTQQPGWLVHRAVPWYSMFDDWTGHGADDAWRAFNYVHVANTYFNMYRIAQRYGFDFLGEKLDWLRKAHSYAIAMFTHWMFPKGEGGDKFGNMGELVIALELPAALELEGLHHEAAQLRGFVTKKAHYFASKEYPFGSEMAFDSTAFEAVYAYGKAIGDARVMESSLRASLANRGRQPVWYLYMTDLRASGDSQWNASYMTQLGAYPIFDWALHEGHHEPELIKAAYASYLAGFSIFNSGGYLSDDPDNAGASGWIVVGEKGEFSGVDQNVFLKGVVALSGESALGYFGALKCAASMLYDEAGSLRPLGCELEMTDDGYIARPQDGLRSRYFDTSNNWAVTLERDALETVELRKGALTVVVENITHDEHVLTFMVRPPASGLYTVLASGCDEIITQELSTGWNAVQVGLSAAPSTVLCLSLVAPTPD